MANDVYLVLLADDSDDDRVLFQLALKKTRSMRLVSVAQDGEQTIAYLSGRGQFADREKFPYPDVLFLDLKMPRVSGFEVLTWLQDTDRKPFIAVFSGSEIESDVKRALSLGADVYQVKPSSSDAYAGVLTKVEEQFLTWRAQNRV